MDTVFFISNRFISNQYQLLKILSNFSTGTFIISSNYILFFYGAFRNGCSSGAQTKRIRIIKEANKGRGGIKIINTE